MPKKRSEVDAESRPIWPEKVIGGKYVRLLDKQLRRLRGEYQHGNRRLFLDDVFIVYLLAYFNPTVRSLRMVEDFSQAPLVQKHLSIRQICRSTLSDFNQLIDPSRLEPIVKTLRGQLVSKQRSSSMADDDLSALLDRTVAVDGTFLPAVAEVLWSVANSNNHQATRHRARLDARLHVASWVPEAIVVPEPGQSEADSAIRHMQPGRVYLYDRGFMSFGLIRAHYQQTEGDAVVVSHFVVRYKPAGANSPELHDAKDRPLAAEDLAAGVVSDRIGRFESTNALRAGIGSIPLREVVITYEEKGETKTLRLITNLLDCSARTIALLYKLRWQVELFFRWFKTFANFNHLISHHRDGVLAHLYVTIIAVMLMYLHTGYRPSKYLFALLSLVAAGAATLEEIMPILRERERQCELARQSAARRRAQKRSQ